MQSFPVAMPIKGRGASTALAHRFNRLTGESVDDGWGYLDQSAAEETLPPATCIIEEKAKSILSSNQSPDIHFDLSINPYRGCEHVMWRDNVLPDPCISPLPDFF